MKKNLSLLALSLLMIVAMLLSVSATFEDTDVGLYIRFDSQEKIDAHVQDASKSLIDNLAFDDKVGALRYSPNIMENFGTDGKDKGVDCNFTVRFADGVDLSKYPYFRMTYKFPTEGINGMTTDNNTKFCIFYGTTSTGGWNGAYYSSEVLSRSNDWNRTILNSTTVCLTDNGDGSYGVKNDQFSNLKAIRVDIPNNGASNKFYEYYIYDIGFFKTVEAAASYNPIQDFFLLDMSDENHYSKWSYNDTKFNGQYKVEYEYDGTVAATKFVHANTNNQTGADGRASYTFTDPRDWFSPSNLHFISAYYKTNTPKAVFFLNKPLRKDNLKAESYIHAGNATADLSGDENWHLFVKDYSLANAGGYVGFDNTAAVAGITFDPINADSTNSELYRSFQYIAYYDTQEKADKMTQLAPKAITVSAPTAKGGKGTISGLTTDMEYRLSATGKYTAVTAETIEVDAAKSYDIRYKEKEGYNAGYATTVVVPHYWDLNITQLKYSDGEVAVTSESIVKTDKQNWVITVPKGVDVSKLVPVYTFESDATGDYTNYLGNTVTRAEGELRVKADYGSALGRVTLTSGSTAFGSSVVVGENLLHVWQDNAIYEPVTIKFVEDTSVANTAGLLEKLANDVLDTLRTVDGDGNVTLTNVAHNALLAKANAADISNAVKPIADKLVARYKGVTATITVSDFTPSTAGTAADKDGTDGKCSVKISMESSVDTSAGEVSATEANMPIPAAHYRIILNFASPILQGYMSLYQVVRDGKQVPGLLTETIIDENALGGAYLRLTKDDTVATNAEFNFTLYPGDGVIPAIPQLADYPVIVYRDRNSVAGNYQIYYYTTGYGGDHAYQQKSRATGTEFENIIFETSFAGSWTGKPENKGNRDTSWSNKLNSIRFDFMRPTQNAGRYTDLDYIGFFATKADAEAFIAAPKLDNAVETQQSINEKYADELSVLSGIEHRNGTVITLPTECFDFDEDGKFINKSIIERMCTVYYNDKITPTTANCYFVISNKVVPVAGTAENINGTDGSFTFRVYFADSPVNGFAATTQTITVNVVADKYIDCETLGAQIRTNGTDALRFGAKVNVGANKLITGINPNAETYSGLAPECTVNLKFGMFIVPEAALTAEGLTADDLKASNLTVRINNGKVEYWLGDYQVADVACEKIYSADSDSFVYTAAVTGIADADLKLVARPYAAYEYKMFNDVSTLSCIYFEPVVRSYNAVQTALAETPNAWDK